MTSMLLVAGARLLPAEAEWCLYLVDGFWRSLLLLLILLLWTWVCDPTSFHCFPGCNRGGLLVPCPPHSFSCWSWLEGSCGKKGQGVNPWSG